MGNPSALTWTVPESIPEFEWFGSMQIEGLANQSFRVHGSSNRMGLRLMGEPLDMSNVPEMISSGPRKMLNTI